MVSTSVIAFNILGQRSINNIVTKICTAGELIIKFKEYQVNYNRSSTEGEEEDLNQIEQ